MAEEEPEEVNADLVCSPAGITAERLRHDAQDSKRRKIKVFFGIALVVVVAALIGFVVWGLPN